MRFTVSQSALQAALAVVSKGTATNSTMPIIAGILIRASEGTLEFRATDLSISIRHSIAANVEEPGETVVSGRMLSSIVKSLPDAPITFDGGQGTVDISCQRVRFALNTLPAADFPEFPQVEPESSVELPRELLSSMVDRVYRVTSKDTSRPILGGILLTVDSNLVSLVATDSYRLAVVDAHVETSTLTGEFRAIVPGGAFHGALQVMGGAENVLVGASGTQVLFSSGTTTFVARRIEGTFPDYQRLLPASCETSVRLEVEALSDALHRVSLVATANPSVRFDVDADGGLLTLSAMSADAGEAREQLEAPTEGANVVTALNHRYVSDCIGALSGEKEIDLELQGPVQPAVFKSYGALNYLYLLMPVRL